MIYNMENNRNIIFKCMLYNLSICSIKPQNHKLWLMKNEK